MKGMLICTGRLENAPLPCESKTPYLINRHCKSAELIVTDIHIKLQHISIKQTLTEVRRRFWICRGRGFIRNILSKCTLCRRFAGPCYSYTTTPPLTKLSYVSHVDNFGPLYVKDTFDKDNHELHKVWVTLYTCAASSHLRPCTIHRFRFISRLIQTVHQSQGLSITCHF